MSNVPLAPTVQQQNLLHVLYVPPEAMSLDLKCPNANSVHLENILLKMVRQIVQCVPLDGTPTPPVLYNVKSALLGRTRVQMAQAAVQCVQSITSPVATGHRRASPVDQEPTPRSWGLSIVAFAQQDRTSQAQSDTGQHAMRVLLARIRTKLARLVAHHAGQAPSLP